MAATPARVKRTNSTTTDSDGPVISLTEYVKRESGYDPDTVVVKYKKAEFYGLTFRVQAAGMNVFNALSMGDGEDGAAVTQSILRLIHPEDRSAFRSHVAALPDYDVKVLIPTISGLIGIASEGKVPTSSGGSSRTTPRKAVASRSVGD